MHVTQRQGCVIYVHISARAQVRTSFPYPWNGWTHCAEIWWVFMEQLPMHFTHVQRVEFICTSSRAYFFPYLGMHWKHCVEIWYVVRPINCAFYTTTSRGYLHVRICYCTHFLGTSAHFRSFVAIKASYWCLEVCVTADVIRVLGCVYFARRNKYADIWFKRLNY